MKVKDFFMLNDSVARISIGHREGLAFVIESF
jgi:hypothetical protein